VEEVQYQKYSGRTSIATHFPLLILRIDATLASLHYCLILAESRSLVPIAPRHFSRHLSDQLKLSLSLSFSFSPQPNTHQNGTRSEYHAPQTTDVDRGFLDLGFNGRNVPSFGRSTPRHYQNQGTNSSERSIQGPIRYRHADYQEGRLLRSLQR